MNKLRIVESITCTLGISGVLATVLGGGAYLGGLTAVSTIELGKFLAPNRPTYQKMMLYGGFSLGAGLVFVGAGIGIAKFVGERMADEEWRRIEAAKTASKEKAEKVEEPAYRTWSNWQEYEHIKVFCRGCDHYRDGGCCALHKISILDCSDRFEKPSCSNCKYYSASELLPCAVHPGLKENCPDWESSSNN